MTYKAIVTALVEKSAREWVEKLLSEAGYVDYHVFADDTDLTNDPKADTMLWTVKVWARIGQARQNFEVGGTADDICGICNSVIWDDGRHKILWMGTTSAREQLGITGFLKSEKVLDSVAHI